MAASQAAVKPALDPAMAPLAAVCDCSVGEVSPDRAAQAIADRADFDLHRHLDLLTRAWKLRDNLTAYDAMYVALAEALDAPILTCDTPLANAPGHRAHIEVIV